MDRPPKGFRYDFIRLVKMMSLAGEVSNASIARRLDRTEAQIRNYRRCVREFDRACDMALSHAIEAVSCVVYQAAVSGDDIATSKWWLERRASAFKPKQQLDHVSNGNTLKTLLAEHGAMDEGEARQRGLIYDDDEDCDGEDEDEDYDGENGVEDGGYAEGDAFEDYDED